MTISITKIFKSLFLTLLTCGLTACATHTTSNISNNQTTMNNAQTMNMDPYENYNRHAFALNQAVDKVILIPIAKVYRGILPWPVRTGISNFFSNFSEVPSFASHILRGEPKAAGITGLRFAVNSTIGVFGLVDVASKMHLEQNRQDFGTAFGKWGYKNSPYLVLPLWGPSTVRDTIGLPFDYWVGPYTWLYPKKLRTQLFILNTIRFRAELLDSDNTINEAALDRYTFERDAYLQIRAHMINSGTVNGTAVEVKQLTVSETKKDPQKTIKPTVKESLAKKSSHSAEDKILDEFGG